MRVELNKPAGNYQRAICGCCGYKHDYANSDSEQWTHELEHTGSCIHRDGIETEVILVSTLHCSECHAEMLTATFHVAADCDITEESIEQYEECDWCHKESSGLGHAPDNNIDRICRRCDNAYQNAEFQRERW